ncbi:MAG: glycosyltransferase family 39 protein [Candidatus Kerfeldbacteria bacterium]|nr:glycosyltransferase family 39 protein [Candidatus Kerfeldbacteria bacterium]
MKRSKLLNFSTAAYLLIVLFFIVNVVTLKQYGMTYDERNYAMIGQMNVEYFHTLDRSQIHPLDDLMIYYGPAYHIVQQVFGLFAQAVFHLGYIDATHLFLVCTSTAMLLVVFFFARSLFRPSVGLCTVVLLMLFPHFIAHAHYNPKDLPEAEMVTISLYLFYRLYSTKRYVYAILAGAVYGFGLATVVSILLAVPIFVASYLSFLVFQERIYQRKDWRVYLLKDVLLFFVFAIVLMFTMVLSWPLLWSDPHIFVESIRLFRHHSWNGQVLYFGQTYLGSEIPWHYVLLSLFMATPLLPFCFFIVGLVRSGKQILHRKEMFPYAFILCWAALPLIIFMLPGAVNYDGIRHFFMAIPPLMILAGVGMDAVIRGLKNILHTRPVLLPTIFCIIVVGWLVNESRQVHPYEGAYFNELVRLIIPAHIETVFEVEYWGASYREGVDWLNTHAAPNAVVCVPDGMHMVEMYPRRLDILLHCGDDSTYVMYYTRGGPRKIPAPMLLNQQSTQRVYTISRQHSDYLYIVSISSVSQ